MAPREALPSYHPQDAHEATWLLGNNSHDIDTSESAEIPSPSIHRSRSLKMAVTTTVALVVLLHGVVVLQSNPTALTPDSLYPSRWSDPMVGLWGRRKKKGKKHDKKKKQKKKKKKKDKDEDNDDSIENNQTYLSQWEPPEIAPRCDWVMKSFLDRDAGTPPKDLEDRYLAQSVDPNVFYRATAHIFWKDFAGLGWGKNFTDIYLLHNDPDSRDESGVDDKPDNKEAIDGVLLTRKSVWTWVTGDQHLSNFGAWRNRHNDVVFGVNDFDEAAIYDFQIDVVRIAVSITSHAITNGFDDDEVNQALMVFTENYVETILNYQDNEKALLFELTPKTSYGALQKFLQKTERKKSSQQQMKQFTVKDPTTGKRHFIKGSVDVPHAETNLASVPREMEEEIKQAFSETHYGATMMKLGWAVLEWDDDYFEVLDVAERVGSGIGSFGVDRYFVLLKGTDGLLQGDGQDGTAVILDVKYQRPSSVSRVLTEETKAWYNVLFAHEAERVVQAQRALTSYTDPYLGWVILRNLDRKELTFGQEQCFSVRQRSPWKDSPDLDQYVDSDDFNDFVAQIAASTATSHVRGTVAKAPGDFKRVIAYVLGASPQKRIEWGEIIAKAAKSYREQVLLDYKCFKNYVKERWGPW